MAPDRPRKGKSEPPVPQLETAGTAPVPPDAPKPNGEASEPGQGLLARLRGRLRNASRQEHLAFAPEGPPTADKLRQLPTSLRRTPVDAELAVNRSYLSQAFGESWDIVFRDLQLGDGDRQALLVYVDGLVDKAAIQRYAIMTLTLEARSAGIRDQLDAPHPLDEIQTRVIGFGEVRLSHDLAEIADRLVSGESALFVAGETAAIMMDTRGWRDRGIQEPATETAVRGPREGFNETLKTSTALLRRRLKTPMLRLERAMIGDYTKTDIVVAYIEGLANPEVVREVRRRLNRIVIDGFIESRYIEELIQDDPYSLFPLVRATEYPDRVAASLLEGAIAIMADTTPFVLVVPVTLPGLLQASEDHFEAPAVVTGVRLIRVLCLLLAMFGSAFYVAAASYQPEVIPTVLLERLIAARVGVPFGAVLEVLILEVAFEILREAGIRMPRPIGQAVSIVGALVLGEAAVAAGLVSSAIVIVVALSAIASLALPPYFLTLGIRLLRFPLILLAASLGLFGLAIGAAVLLAHMASLSSFGVPYLAPVAPFNLASWRRDVIIRSPRWAMDSRPDFLGPQQPRRAGDHQKPGPDQPNPPSSEDAGGKPEPGDAR